MANDLEIRLTTTVDGSSFDAIIAGLRAIASTLEANPMAVKETLTDNDDVTKQNWVAGYELVISDR